MIEKDILDAVLPVPDLMELKDFAFQQHPRIHAEQERLDALSRIVQGRIHLILSD